MVDGEFPQAERTIDELREQVTVLKAERDEAREWGRRLMDENSKLRADKTMLTVERDEVIRTRDEVHQQLMDLLARIHRDGGQYVDEHGVEKALEVAHCHLATTFTEPTQRSALDGPEDLEVTFNADGKNRMELARRRAGLSIGQAAKLFGLECDELIVMESAPEIDSEWNTAIFAGTYGVSVEWLTGQVPRYDHEAMKDVPGWDAISQHDKDVLAEFAASLPKGMATPVMKFEAVRKRKWKP